MGAAKKERFQGALIRDDTSSLFPAFNNDDVVVDCRKIALASIVQMSEASEPGR
jgi:hypothetical protein